MKVTQFVLGVALAFGAATAAEAAIVASNDFDAPLNLISSSGTTNNFGSPADGWGIYNRSADAPFSLIDESVEGFNGRDPFLADSLGVVRSDKLDNWFGIVDTTNGDNLEGTMVAEFVFDVSSASSGLTSVDIDMAAMGDFEDADLFTISFSLDGSAFTDLFTNSVDNDASKEYTMEGGTPFILDDPMSVNGIELTNQFQTVSSSLSGTGNELTLRVTGNFDGASEVFAFDNIVVNGITAIPEPSTALLLALGCCTVGLNRRRRSR